MTQEALRSWLYVPAHDERKIRKAAQTEADVVILDLEDGTPDTAKKSARSIVADVLRSVDFGASRRFVRINSPDTRLWREDVYTTAAGEPDGFVIPKANSPAAVATVAAVVSEACPGNQPQLAPILTEDVTGVFAARDTADAHESVRTVFWGSEDLSAAIGAWAVKDDDGNLLDPFRLVRSLALLAAAHAGRRIIDTPFLTIGDQDGLQEECRLAAKMGFSGKQCIHPEQIEIVNREFTPNDDDVAHARELVAAFTHDGAAVVRSNDQMADAPHLKRAQHILHLAASAALKDRLHQRSQRFS